VIAGNDWRPSITDSEISDVKRRIARNASSLPGMYPVTTSGSQFVSTPETTGTPIGALPSRQSLPRLESMTNIAFRNCVMFSMPSRFSEKVLHFAFFSRARLFLGELLHAAVFRSSAF